jgi:hypothetical protein
LDPETNLIVPDVRLRLIEGKHSVNKRTNNPALKFQVDVYGAPLGVESVFQGASAQLSSACTEYLTEAKGEVRRLRCEPQTEEEGSHLLKIEGHGVNGTTEEVFDWVYDITPPEVNVTIKDEVTWERDGTLHVQLEAKAGSEDIDWNSSELFADGHRIALSTCSQNVAAAKAECAVPLSALPHLPHGNHDVDLRFLSVDEAGNKNENAQGESGKPPPLNINRVLWRTDVQPWTGGSARPVVTREGWVIVQSAANQMVALDARNQGARKWPRPFSADDLEGASFMLGNHRGTQVLVKTCADGTSVGLEVIDAQKGEPLLDCSEPRDKFFSMALLQGSPSQDLMLVRSVVDQDTGDGRLEACQLSGNGSPMSLSCSQHDAGISGTDSPIVVQPQGASTAIYLYNRSFFTVFWRENHEWKSTFNTGPATEEGFIFGVGTQYLWGNTWVSPIDGTSLSSGVGSFTAGTPWAIDDQDELIVSFGENLSRLNPKRSWLATVEPNGASKKGFLMEGGDIVLAGDRSSVAVWSPGLTERWKSDFSNMFGIDAIFGQATLVPLSETRSVLVVEVRRNTIAAFSSTRPASRKMRPGPCMGMTCAAASTQACRWTTAGLGRNKTCHEASQGFAFELAWEPPLQTLRLPCRKNPRLISLLHTLGTVFLRATMRRSS